MKRRGRALRSRYGRSLDKPQLSDPSRKYMVRFVHKISPSESDVAGPIILSSVAIMGDRRTFGGALRDSTMNMRQFGNALGGAKGVRSFRIEAGGRIVAFPSNPSIWHSIIFTPVSDSTPMFGGGR